MSNVDKVDFLYNIKRSHYITQGIEITDELDDVLLEEAINEVVARCYINERGIMNGIKIRLQKDS